MNQGKAPKEPAPAKSISLGRVLNQSEEIKERVEEAATALASVHLALKQEGTVAPPAQTVDEAVVQIEAVEEKVVRAAEDLHEVNGELAREVAERTVLEILFKNADRAMYRAKETGKAVMLCHQMASDCP